MIIDYELQLSTEQAIVATAASTDFVDTLSQKDQEGLDAVVRVGQTFTNLTSLRVAIEGGNTHAAGVPTWADATEIVGKDFLLAALTINKLLALPRVPAGSRFRFLRFKFTVTGTAPGAGKITAALHPAPLLKPNNGVVSA